VEAAKKKIGEIVSDLVRHKAASLSPFHIQWNLICGGTRKN
jgi:hypothetical protein